MNFMAAHIMHVADITRESCWMADIMGHVRTIRVDHSCAESNHAKMASTKYLLSVFPPK